ncbi:hypothetical protein CF327_g1109 [Tilletia walkeri]|uniref:ATP-dependent (S)-NAD(P)H-hydrate dehydratase n=1 Tax=Tilletia walkeri TaxID=117179 RepID=A0A8X7NEP4_9BASI|nr:hypothetical protein CF327_g1109 [Tilletia walkeri]KAE8271688.1 hypothetical protein A4X09_0g623 [Tilletia walkeri]
MSASPSSSAAASRILSQVKSIIPPLSAELHKGQAGRVGIVGGSKDYTGAPYFASMASMKLGADMSHTICEPSAGNVIKTYSPDLIVHRIMDENKSLDSIRSEMKDIFARLHSVVVGPGLGRDQHMQDCGQIAIELAREANLYIVVDADGLWLLQNKPEIIKGYQRAVLTPNVVEFGRLCKKLGVDPKQNPDEAAKELSRALQGPTILEKGKVDRIANADEVLVSEEPGGLKRCGGQGDILSGCLTTFLAWAHVYSQGNQETSTGPPSEQERIQEKRLPLLAAYGASTIARTCSREGFRRNGRAFLANDMIEEIGRAYIRHFGDPQAAL